jgi:polyhydroxyalkanoate synthesis repressor PhaR
MARVIKRYGNRKMYDPQTSRYVTLDGIAELVRAGEDLRIIDNENGEDLTALTFAQIIFEEEKRKSGVLGLPVLRWIIQQGGATLQEILTSVDRGREALGNVRELAEKGVRQLVQGGDRHTADGPARRRLLNDILELPQKQIEQLQHRIDAQVRASLERVTSHPAFQSELRRIEHSIKNLERQLTRLRRSHSEVQSQRTARQRTAKKGTAR